MNDQLRTLRRPVFLAASIMFAAGALAGCAGPPPPTSPPATTGSPVTSFTTPPPEPTTTSSPTTASSPGTRGDGGPIVSLPRLPIGGDAVTDEDDPALQCVAVSWIVTKSPYPDIPPGYAVEITGATFSGRGFEVVRGPCGSDAPACVGRIMRAGAIRCSLAVRARPDADPDVTVSVGLKGIAYCPSAGQRCRQFVDAVAREPGVTIRLNPPPGTATSSTGPEQSTGPIPGSGNGVTTSSGG
ncbi:hypothetical protein [Intrasporangium sp.]|uniref:hypothetical protein n=1 Tax=Intrasporangium sp. TaxID=1925024 RepID=UPI003221D415